MKKTARICCIGSMSLLACLASSAIWAQSKTQMPLTSASSPQFATTTSSSIPGNLCAVGERTVFSCVLKRNKKSVSLCAAKDLSHFYYIYGHPGAPELIYPPQDQSVKNPFMRTFLSYAGDTGGYSYSFINKGVEYIIYYISGRSNFQDGGIIIRRVPGSQFVTQDMSCRKSSIYEPDDTDITNATLKWPPNVDIKEHGLPSTH
jgi:hypothetical protein